MRLDAGKTRVYANYDAFRESNTGYRSCSDDLRVRGGLFVRDVAAAGDAVLQEHALLARKELLQSATGFARGIRQR